MTLKIITTEDGSQSLFHEELNETYHSTKGAQSESKYVFLEKGLDHWMGNHPASTDPISVLEVGFGTGLNGWLTWKWTQEKNRSVDMVTLEPFPVGSEIRGQMDLAKDIHFNLIHSCPWEEQVRLSDFFKIEKRQARLENLQELNKYDVIFFDAFAPSKQPEIWSTDNLRSCYASLKKGGCLTTYCAQGQFKRDLAEVGFDVEVLPGALGKKEMVRGFKQ